jgi:DNA-binding NtrC family response regulator
MKGYRMSEPSTQHRVFVVDDEHVIASSLAMILCHEGFDAIPYTLPLDALEASRSKAPDLLISDVLMPRLSGIDLAIQVQENCPECRVLLFSGQAATANLLDTARANGHDFELLSKPIHPSELLKKIQSVFATA